MNRVISLLIVLLLALMAVSTAFASPPEREIFEVDDVYPMIYCGDDIGVGDFWVMNNEVATARFDYFYNQDGQRVREKLHVSGIDHLFAEGYPNKVIVGHWSWGWTDLLDPVTGEYTYSHDHGNYWNLQLPGYGNVFHSTGMEKWEYVPDAGWISVKRNGLDIFDPVPICEYLAP